MRLIGVPRRRANRAPGRPAQRHADVLHLRLQRDAAPAIAESQLRALLHEGAAWAPHRTTAKPTDAVLDVDATVCYGLVHDVTHIVGVHVTRASAARRTPNTPPP